MLYVKLNILLQSKHEMKPDVPCIVVQDQIIAKLD